MFDKLKAEFPTFDLNTLPAIPGEWVDSSWHNDTCPSFKAFEDRGGRAVYVFIDFADHAEREHSEGARFTVLDIPWMKDPVTLLESDDWAAVLAAISCINIGKALPEGFDAAVISQKIALAREFGSGIQEALSRADFLAAVERNKASLHPDVCHTHDFCDANMIMLEAFKTALGRTPVFLNGSETAEALADLTLWGDAWQISKAAEFFA